MLTLNVSEKELFDERTNSFINVPAATIHLEHSLISLSRWESKWKKPYLGKEEKTKEELDDYIACMCMDKNVDPLVFKHLGMDQYKQIMEYMADPHTATKIYDRRPNRGGKEPVYTSEVLYYWMIYYGIPEAFEKWNLNRLMTLIRVCNIKGGTSQQEMDLNSIYAQNRQLHAARKKR